MASRIARIVTVCLLGRKARRSKTNRRRAAFLNTIAAEIASQSTWRPIDAVLLPGGFFRLKHCIASFGHEARPDAVDASRGGRACAAASMLLDAAFKGVALVVGLDSAPVDQNFGGDNLVVAWRGGRIIGLGRMVFPADANTNGVYGLPLRCVAEDFGSPHRIIGLRNGSRALLCACYDMFALRALVHGAPDPSSTVRHLDDGPNVHDPPSPARRRELLDDWRRLIMGGKVDVGLTAIHEFEAPGRDSYWQRHGIAYASAALGGGMALGASHFRKALPKADASTLAAFGVGRRHLTLGAHRTARQHQPIASLVIDGDGREQPAAIVRLFEAG